jgi:hypothetical protein
LLFLRLIDGAEVLAGAKALYCMLCRIVHERSMATIIPIGAKHKSEIVEMSDKIGKFGARREMRRRE